MHLGTIVELRPTSTAIHTCVRLIQALFSRIIPHQVSRAGSRDGQAAAPITADVRLAGPT